ncbi:hypothetical protein [Gordonia humi]|uniref:Uncharacterized protein n=1 Tax=Gordonia humi TaxID=686429 RepID=A0A840ES78_9ACTN|nr:hypothetical protein [Gordonia humi]MBB4134552.1 hypothetical protein [Gordonia humi]
MNRSRQHGPVDELRALASLIRRFDAEERAASAPTALVDEARRVAALPRTGDDTAFGAARCARIATARAIVLAAGEETDGADPASETVGAGHEWRVLIGLVLAGLRSAPRRIGGEIRHVLIDRPHSILLRLVITLGISLAFVAFYEFSGWSNYTAAQLMLYLYSGLVGSVVCTNALCFEADRTRALMVDGEPAWRILITKNIAMASMMLVTGIPAIAILVAGPSQFSVVAVVDQFLVMIFVWLGIANVLSVASPLRHEPLSARLHDGTWLPYVVSFAVSYGVGLTVNLMIFWQLWARNAASDKVAGGALTAFVLVLVSSILLWLLLTVLAATAAENRELRRALDREMIAYRPDRPPRS